MRGHSDAPRVATTGRTQQLPAARSKGSVLAIETGCDECGARARFTDAATACAWFRVHPHSCAA